MFAARSLLSVPVVLAALVSVATLACGGSGSSGFGGDGGGGGLGTGATATPQSGCAALTQWATKCGFTVDQVECEAQATGHTSAQLQAATECTKTTSCDEATVDACVNKALASNPPQTNGSGGLGSSSGGTVPDAGGGGGMTGCETCTRTSCTTEVATCEALPACVTLYGCVSAAAGDKDKTQACIDQDDSGLSQLQAVVQCQIAKCGSLCR